MDMEAKGRMLHDPETGEFYEGVIRVITADGQKAIDEKKELAAFKAANWYKSEPFFFSKTKGIKEADTSLTMKQWGYFAVLSCYIDYNNMLKMDTQSKVPMDKKEMCKVLRISQVQTLSPVIKKFKGLGLLTEKIVNVYGTDRTAFYLNDDLVFRTGVSNKRSVKGTTKVFMKNLKGVYAAEKVSPADVGFIWRCLPYVNKHHNFLTHDNEEKDAKNDKSITQTELARILALDKKTIAYKLKSLKWNDMSVFSVSAVERNRSIKVNPLIVYGKKAEPVPGTYEEFLLK